MNKDQNVNELIDQIIDRQEAINELLEDTESMSDDLAEALQRIAEEQEKMIDLLGQKLGLGNIKTPRCPFVPLKHIAKDKALETED